VKEDSTVVECRHTNTR